MFIKRIKILELLGCVTTRHVQQVPRAEWETRTVGEVLAPCGEENTLDLDRGDETMQALSRMGRDGVSRLMVVRGGRLLGMLSLKDLLKFISLKVELEEDGAGGVRTPLIREETG